MTIEEEWRAIPSYEDIYEVSNLGRVRSLDRLDCAGHKRRGRILKLYWANNGSLTTQLNSEGVGREFSIARLIMEAWGPLPPTAAAIPVHENGDKADCTAANLRWGSPNENWRLKMQGKMVRGLAALAKLDELGIEL